MFLWLLLSVWMLSTALSRLNSAQWCVYGSGHSVLFRYILLHIVPTASNWHWLNNSIVRARWQIEHTQEWSERIDGLGHCCKKYSMPFWRIVAVYDYRSVVRIRSNVQCRWHYCDRIPDQMQKRSLCLNIWRMGSEAQMSISEQRVKQFKTHDKWHIKSAFVRTICWTLCGKCGQGDRAKHSPEFLVHNLAHHSFGGAQFTLWINPFWSPQSRTTQKHTHTHTPKSHYIVTWAHVSDALPQNI